MSWCGGGLIRPTPGVAYLIRAMCSSTLLPGSSPPSPGLAPCEILICNSSALVRYQAVTPNRPDATCLIADRFESPLDRVLNRSGDSPPSPVLLFPPTRFIATASVSCASLEMEPRLIAPVQNRRKISAAGSTSEMSTGLVEDLNSIKPRSV